MAPGLSRNRVVAGLALATVVAMGATPSAHRRDEYLQAARIAVDPDRVQVELDLIAGISVAEAVIRDIDRDGSGSITRDEARKYATAVVGTVRMDIDRMPLQVELVNVTMPALEAIRNGEGAIRLELTATLPALASGTHQIFFLNAHRADIGVYLANALAPVSPRIAIAAQRRDVAQREITIDYALTSSPVTRGRALLPLGALALLSLAAFGWMRKQTI